MNSAVPLNFSGLEKYDTKHSDHNLIVYGKSMRIFLDILTVNDCCGIDNQINYSSERIEFDPWRESKYLTGNTV